MSPVDDQKGLDYWDSCKLSILSVQIAEAAGGSWKRLDFRGSSGGDQRQADPGGRYIGGPNHARGLPGPRSVAEMRVEKSLDSSSTVK